MAESEVTPEIRSLWPGYLRRRADDVAFLRQALDARNYAEIRRRAHNMKGSGGSYGLHEISRLAEKLENAATREAEADVGATLDEMETTIGRLVAMAPPAST